MGWFSENKEDDERFWNLVVYDVYMTDKEFEEAAPAIFIISLILLAIIGGVAYFAT